jgi:sigma-B regulation protein RsbU (phosphoserine phosphatase)
MNNQTFQMTMTVLNTACVLIVVAYLLIRSGGKFSFTRRPANWREFLLLSGVFGGFSLYAAFNSIRAFDAVVSLRHTGALVGGLVAGPWVGMTAGLIGAVDRYLQGGPSMVSAVLAVVLAGFFAGLYVGYVKKGRIPGIWEAVLFVVLYELFAGLLTLGLVSDWELALRIERNVRLPLVIGNAVAVGLFIACIQIFVREKEILKTKNQIEGELNAARSIQMSMVPNLFPTFPHSKEFELHALMRPAKEVGGDLYNFLPLGNGQRFCFMVGDVSGKGVPASLFMAVAKTLLESEARASEGLDCSAIMARANDGLCRGNDQSMFVTVLLGVLDIRTGVIDYCSAGHMPPFLLRRDGNITHLHCDAGVALGVMEDMSFQHQQITLAPGDTLVLYTDGVSEAFSPAGAPFGDDGLARALAVMTAADAVRRPPDVTQGIMAAVDRFAAEEPQADDITLLALKYHGASEPANPAKAEGL